MAFLHLVQHLPTRVKMIDCQQQNGAWRALSARNSREVFVTAMLESPAGGANVEFPQAEGVLFPHHHLQYEHATEL